MSVSYRVALEGFGAFERRSLQSYFQAASSQGLRFDASAALLDSDLCVVDGDRPAVVEEVRQAGRLDRSVFVGSEPPAGAVVHLGRPINPRLVARALETLLLALTGDAHPDAPKTLKPAMPLPAKPAPAVVAADSAAEAVNARKAGKNASQFPIDVLVFEENDIAASPLIAQLEKLGCRVSVARHAEEAPRLLAQNPVRMVFSDVHARGSDGLALCQQIKAVRKGAPSVVLMSPHVTSIDRVRAQLAGADALLAKPVTPVELLGVLNDASNRRRRAR